MPHGLGRLRYVHHVVGKRVLLFRLVCELDVEGIVAKRRNGAYDPKATTWIKVKNVNYTQARDRWELVERCAPTGRR